MKLQRNVLYESSDEYFACSGSAVMYLNASAAAAVCHAATDRGLVVVRVEGGIWRQPGFEARVDCIWDGADPPMSRQECKSNNSHAAAFIESECSVHDAFVLTTAPVTGYEHKSKSSPSQPAP
jgi:hypothetical protein